MLDPQARAPAVTALQLLHLPQSRRPMWVWSSFVSIHRRLEMIPSPGEVAGSGGFIASHQAPRKTAFALILPTARNNDPQHDRIRPARAPGPMGHAGVRAAYGEPPLPGNL